MADPTAIPPTLVHRSPQELIYAMLLSALGLGSPTIGPIPQEITHRSVQELLYALKSAIDALVAGGSGIAWGSITGTLSAQTDLQSALNAKPTAALDTDGTLVANSDAKVATQKAVVTYVSSLVTGLLDFKGNTDCSANPNYPVALKGDAYVVSVAGKIGGASGKIVEIGDTFVASADNAGGTEASVGTSWFVLQANITGITAAGLLIMRAADAAAQRTALGLGTAALSATTDFDAAGAAATKIGGTLGATANRVPVSNGTGGLTLQASTLTVDPTTSAITVVEQADESTRSIGSSQGFFTFFNNQIFAKANNSLMWYLSNNGMEIFNSGEVRFSSSTAANTYDARIARTAAGMLNITGASIGAQLAKVGGCIFDHYADVATSSTNGTEDDLYSDTLAAATLAANGQKIVESEYLSIASSATASRRVKKYFGGTLIFDSGAVTLAAGADGRMVTEIIRESPSVVRVTVTVSTTSASTMPYVTYTRITGLTLANTQILKTTGIASGTGAASGDITNKMATISWHPAA